MSTRNSHGTHVCRWAAAAVLALLSLGASAQDRVWWREAQSWLMETAGNKVRFTAPTSRPSVPTGPISYSSTGKVLWNTAAVNLPVPGSNGRTIPLSIKQPLQWASSAAAAARWLAGGPLGAALLAYGAYQFYEENQLNWSDEQKPMKPNPLSSWYCYHPASYEAGTSPSQYKPGMRGAVYEPNAIAVGAPCHIYNDVYSPTLPWAQGTWEKSGPELPDTPMTAGEIEELMEANAPLGMARLVEGAIVDGGEEVLTDGDPEVTGPATIPGPETVRVEETPDGPRTITNTTTYHIHYDGDTVTVTSSVSTVTNHPNGTTTTETETSETPPPNDECKQNPSSLACAELDSPTAQVPTATETISYSQDDLGFGGGACPPPFPFATSMGDHTIDLGPFCDQVSSVVRPLVLLAATVMAIFIVVPGIRTE